MVEIYLFQASSSSILKFLRKVFSTRLIWQSKVSLDLPDISNPSVSASPKSPDGGRVHVCSRCASKPLLSPLYRGPYLVPRHSEKFFVLQIGEKSDSVFSSVPIVPGVPPVWGRPHLIPASIPGPSVKRKWDSLRFQLHSSAGTLTGQLKVLRLSPLYSILTFWGEYLWLLPTWRRPLELSVLSLHLLKMKRDLSGITLCKAWSGKT